MNSHFRFKLIYKLAVFPGAIGVAVSQNFLYSYCTGEPPLTHDANDISIYLSEESQLTLKAHLKKVGLGSYSFEPRVLVRRNADRVSNYELEPLFGERVAFRLKGVAHLPAQGYASVRTSYLHVEDNMCLNIFISVKGLWRLQNDGWRNF